MGRILMLNRSFIPIRLVSRFNVIGKMYCEQAEPFFIEGDKFRQVDWQDWLKLSLADVWPSDQDFIQAVSQRIAVPKVAIYTEYDKIPKVSFRLSRKSIYERDKYQCYICGETYSEGKLSIDHVVPLSKGGKNNWENMVTCCKRHNFEKGDKLLSELKWRPKFLPQKPVLSNMQKLKASITHYDPCWKLFGFS